MNQFRQGDVFLARVDTIPQKGMKKIYPDKRGYVLAEGEATGHAHTIARTDLTSMWAGEEGTFLKVKEPGVDLEHQEHGTLFLDPGEYNISLQREYTPERVRRVAD